MSSVTYAHKPDSASTVALSGGSSRPSELWHETLAVEQTAADEITTTVSTAAGSPWFAGHFDKLPILPGIAQLKMVVDAACRLRGETLTVRGLSRVKFKQLIRPNEKLHIYVRAESKAEHYRFEITSQKQLVCSGTMILTPQDHITDAS